MFSVRPDRSYPGHLQSVILTHQRVKKYVTGRIFCPATALNIIAKNGFSEKINFQLRNKSISFDIMGHALQRPLNVADIVYMLVNVNITITDSEAQLSIQLACLR